MAEMSEREQEQFAAFLRARLPKPRGARWHALHTFTEYAGRVLSRPRLLHWRGLSREDAQRVMAAARAEYPAGGAS